MPEAPPTSDRATHPFYTYDMIFEIPQAIKQTLQAMEGKVQPIARKLEDSELRSLCDEAVQLPAVDEYLSPFTNIIPLYLFAYYSSVARGFNPDLLRYSTPAYWRGRQVIFPPGTH